MPEPHLVMFDVDGTLVDSLGLESLLFPKACRIGLGIDDVSSDWDSYRNPSDAGIVAELVERHRLRPASPQDHLNVERSFHGLLNEEFGRHPNSCREIPGAAALIEHLRGLPSTQVAVATAGWSSTARLKLKAAGIDIGEAPLASSNDGATKIQIMEVATARALACVGEGGFASKIYVGDSIGDANASAALGFHFVGVGKTKWGHQARYGFKDFADRGTVVDALVSLRDESRRPS